MGWLSPIPNFWGPRCCCLKEYFHKEQPPTELKRNFITLGGGANMAYICSCLWLATLTTWWLGTSQFTSCPGDLFDVVGCVGFVLGRFTCSGPVFLQLCYLLSRCQVTSVPPAKFCRWHRCNLCKFWPSFGNSHLLVVYSFRQL